LLKQGHDIPGAFLDHQELRHTKDTSEEAEKDTTTTSLKNTYSKTTFQHLALLTSEFYTTANLLMWEKIPQNLGGQKSHHIANPYWTIE
jgi:hypothetical protein